MLRLLLASSYLQRLFDTAIKLRQSWSDSLNPGLVYTRSVTPPRSIPRPPRWPSPPPIMGWGTARLSFDWWWGRSSGRQRDWPPGRDWLCAYQAGQFTRRCARADTVKKFNWTFQSERVNIILFIFSLYFYVQLQFECALSNQGDVFYNYLRLTWLIMGGRERINIVCRGSTVVHAIGHTLTGNEFT